MSSAVAHYGKWRIKPSSRLPIFLRYGINSSFTPENAKKNGIKTVMRNRTYLNHMMYWPADEYNTFEREVITHLKKNDGWFEKYCASQLKGSKHLYGLGLKYKKTDWFKKSNGQIKKTLRELLAYYAVLFCSWYVQYPADEYFETAIEDQLAKYISRDDPDFRKYVLTFSDPSEMTDVAEERWKLVLMARKFIKNKEDLNKLSAPARKKINQHLDKFAYINRGLATSKPYTFNDILQRLKEIKKQVAKNETLANLIYQVSPKKVKDDYAEALKKIKPKPDFLRIIKQARHHSYIRNRRVEAFFNADYGASFMYAEIARRGKFKNDWIMEVSHLEMLDVLDGKNKLSEQEMQRRLKNYAMIVRNSQTKLISNPAEIKQLEKQYLVKVDQVKELHGSMACLGGIIRGRAKVCFNKREIGKVKRGDILVAQFTTPDFVPAMEKAAAIVADQGGLSSHAAIVSRELGVPCVIATKNGTRLIRDNDLLEVNAKTGLVKIIKRA